MKILTFDVETTGLPDRWPTIYQTERWPFIVQISWMIYDSSNNKIIVEDHLAKLPKGYGIAPESTKIHGITTKRMLKEGKNIKMLLKKFMNDAKKCKILVAHNIQFDRNVIMVEQIRNGCEIKLGDLRKEEYCTMKNGKTVCNILKLNERSGKMQPKFPKLVELHEKLFKSKPNNLHNSMIDILVCLRCFGHLYWDVDLLTVNKKMDKMWSLLC
jgi:DNA polymerase III epsilon subunit-like protein